MRFYVIFFSEEETIILRKFLNLALLILFINSLWKSLRISKMLLLDKYRLVDEIS